MAKNFKKFISLFVKELPKTVGMGAKDGSRYEIVSEPIWIDIDNVCCVYKQPLYKHKENTELRKYLKEHNISNLYVIIGKTSVWEILWVHLIMEMHILIRYYNLLFRSTMVVLLGPIPN